MKYNIIINGQPLDGYTNVLLTKREIDPRFTFLYSSPNMANVDKNSADEIRAEEIVNMLPPVVIPQIIGAYAEILKKDGILNLSCIDFPKVCASYVVGVISIGDAYNLIMGPNSEHKSITDNVTIANTLKSSGFHINSVTNGDHRIDISATKI
jgi:predicted SAM-dependent methyltransferase